MEDPGNTGTDVGENFGADGYAVSGNDDGGQHHTAFDSDSGGAHFSWDTGPNGDYVDGSAHETYHE
jgi:hypothetical protein